ncbi:pyridoxamine 5'-phosphate oxidase family protein [Desulfovibrio sp.]|uniref:pyridoxamine 5'-phosphate oxidase family protein n=1 Tax=Desulfovibrio sp. TaxID=885 RepID=UPI0025C7237C|nr:pyridoxamine 5'-phosphate oxidase family protein [Desulfovibrio sp.]
MQKVIDFLSANTTVFLATSDGSARVRPFQFQFAEDGRLWFCTGRSKQTFAQLQADPRLEFSCVSPNMVTLRVKGEANLDDNMQIKKRIIENNSLVRSIYGSAESPEFTVFSVDHGTAYMFDFTGNIPESFTF